MKAFMNMKPEKAYSNCAKGSGPSSELSATLNLNKESRLSMPDVSRDSRVDLAFPIERVGMSDIEMPVLLRLPGETPFRIPARIEAFVSLDNPQAKGIHMSRLYEELTEVLKKESVSLKALKHILQGFVKSQEGISHNGYVKIAFELPLERKALVSEKVGWRHYPVYFEGRMDGEELAFYMGVQVAYSSTCPCSAALAKQIIENQFDESFQGRDSLTLAEGKRWLKENSLSATPHAQRSYADVKVKLDTGTIAPEAVELIDMIESALKTSVQAAVKREDEQEFARLNGQNFMFCEDACRRLKKALNSEPRILDYFIKVDHRESLHPHNAVSIGVKGVKGGVRI